MDAPLRYPAGDALGNMRAIDACFESLRTGQAVAIPNNIESGGRIVRSAGFVAFVFVLRPRRRLFDLQGEPPDELLPWAERACRLHHRPAGPRRRRSSSRSGSSSPRSRCTISSSRATIPSPRAGTPRSGPAARSTR
ncbi:MAG: hypothetical protein M0C28_12590 [Candidatus Moduliflexus flocculans]|nr:hypothetical protein [Candidatus Moduliflexus flocculans]